MKALKIKVTTILFSMVGLFAMTAMNTQAFENVQTPACQTPNPFVDPDGPGLQTTECKAPLDVECCISQATGQIFVGTNSRN